MKALCDKPTANILSGEKLKSLSSWIRNKTRIPTLATFLLHSVGSPRAIRQEKEKEDIQMGKEVKFSPFTDNMILYTENPKE